MLSTSQPYGAATAGAPCLHSVWGITGESGRRLVGIDLSVATWLVVVAGRCRFFGDQRWKLIAQWRYRGAHNRGLTEMEVEERCDLSGRGWTRTSPVCDVRMVMVMVMVVMAMEKETMTMSCPTCTETPEFPSRTAWKETSKVGRNDRGIRCCWHLPVECLGRTV